MKIIFLDIDGVLNSERYYITVDRDRAGWNRFDPKVVSFIKKLIEELSVKLVISSSWRFGAFPQSRHIHKNLDYPLRMRKLILFLVANWTENYEFLKVFSILHS